MPIGEPKPKRKITKPAIIIFGIAVLLLIVIVIINTGIINLSGLNGGASIAQIETQVRSMIIVNPNEKPTIASILDIEKVRAQNPEFYANARNGDYLIVFSDKAIIYRVEERILVNVFPILSSDTPVN